MTMPYADRLTVEHIHTNWKSDDPLDLDLGPRVLLVGPNGSGKSSVYEAVELALTGAVSNYSGRGTVRDAKRLWRAKPKRHKALWIKLDLSDGRKIEWRQERSNGKAKWSLDGQKIVEPPVEVHARVSELRSELFGSAQRAEKYLTSALGLGTGRILSELPDTVRELVGDLALTRKPTEVLDSLRKMTREARAEAKAAEQIERELEHHAGLPPTEEEIASTREALDATRNALHEAEVLETVARSLRDTMDEWATIQAAPIQPTPVEGGSMLPLMEATRQMLRTVEKVLPGAQNCPCCQSPFGPAARSARDEALACATQGIYQSQAQDRQYQEQQARLAFLRDEAARLKSALPPALFADVVAGALVDPATALRDATSTLEATLEEQQARRVSAAAPMMARQRAEAAAKRAEALKEAGDAWEKAQSQVVESALAGIVSRASAYFPDRFGAAKIKLRPSVDVGIDRAGTVGAPSGAEEATLMLALAAALSDSARGTAYNLLVMEDRAMDPQSTSALLTALATLPSGQLFVQTVAHAGDADGWTIHRFRREADGVSSASAAIKKLHEIRKQA